jgi:hypothetical protein
VASVPLSCRIPVIPRHGSLNSAHAKGTGPGARWVLLGGGTNRHGAACGDTPPPRLREQTAPDGTARPWVARREAGLAGTTPLHEVSAGTVWCWISIVATMRYTGDPGFDDVDARWIVDGPNSGGVRLLILWREHLFPVEQDFTTGSIGPGITAAEFAATHRDTSDPRYQQILEDLDARGLLN